MARHLNWQLAAEQRRAGGVVWETPETLTWSAWMSRLWQEARQRDLLPQDAPLLLRPLQVQALWRRVLEQDLPAATERTVTRVDAAWRQLVDWEIGRDELVRDRGETLPDVQRFGGWAQVFDRELLDRNWLTGSQLPGMLVRDGLAVRLCAGQTIELHGFLELTPAQKRLLNALRSGGVTVDRIAAPTQYSEVTALRHCDEEAGWLAAAEWAARAWRDDALATIGVVVPNLAAHNGEARRQFAQRFGQAAGLDDPVDWFGPESVIPSTLPPLAGALAIARLSALPADDGSLRRLLLTPRLAGGDAQRWARSALEAVSREHGGIDVPRLIQLARQVDKPWHAPHFAAALEQLTLLRETRLPDTPDGWAQHFGGACRLFGWPGDHPLDAESGAMVEAWRAALADLASLALVESRLGAFQAVQLLQQILDSQDAAAAQPPRAVHLLSIEEAYGMRFDRLWIGGATAQQWPQPSRSNPFLPLGMRRRMGLSAGTPDAVWQRAAEVGRGILTAAPDLVLAVPVLEQGAPAQPAELLDFPAAATLVPRHDPAQAAPLAMEALHDGAGPPVGEGFHGGSALIRAQSDCPFQAFARHRLGLSALPEASLGTSPAQRGTLVHRAAAAFWHAVRDSDTLAALDDAALAEAVARAVQRVLADPDLEWLFPTPVHRELEARRLARVLQRLVESERTRTPFVVEDHERSTRLSLGSLTMRLRLDRVDRVAGQTLVIDYKTGKWSLGKLTGERPSEPQLALYGLALREAAGVAVYQLRPDKTALIGVGELDGLDPAAKLEEGCADWDTLRERWAGRLTRLAEAFAAGDARVDPRPGSESPCRFCELPGLCRIQTVAQEQA